MQIGSFKRDPLEDLKEHQTGTEKKVRNSVLGSSSDSVSDWLGTLEESRHSIFPSGKWEELYSLGADSEAADSRRWRKEPKAKSEFGKGVLLHVLTHHLGHVHFSAPPDTSPTFPGSRSTTW